MTTITAKERDAVITMAKEDIAAFDSRIESLVITGTKQLQYARALVEEVEAHRCEKALGVDNYKMLVIARARIAQYEKEDDHEAMACHVSHERLKTLEAKLQDLGSEYAIVCHFKHQEKTLQAVVKFYEMAIKNMCLAGAVPECHCDACEALAEGANMKEKL